MKVWLRMMTSAVLLAGVSAALPAAAQDALETLLQEVQRGQQQAAEANKAREERFLNNRNEREELLKQARGELGQIKRRTNAQKADFDKQAAEIAALKKQLADQTGDLEQLFGQIRTAAGDARAVVRDSLTSAQFTGRDEILGAMADAERPPSLQQLEQLWYLLQQEMTEAGRIVRFEAQITGADGTSQQAVVARVGGFTAVSGEDFLDWSRDAGVLQVLPRQPPARQRRAAAHFAEATEGPVRMVIDPSRGSLLTLLGERPELEERIAQGGLVGAVIIGLGIFGLLFAAFQMTYLAVIGRRMHWQLDHPDQPKARNPLGRILGLLKEGERVDGNIETLEMKLDEGVIRETPRLERGLGLLKLLAAVAPLLGLLGTVTGMIETFDVIRLFGTGDPKQMAGGISKALVTTVLGLVVAIPLLFVHSVMVTRARSLIRILDEQSAGLMARVMESRQNNG